MNEGDVVIYRAKKWKTGEMVVLDAYEDRRGQKMAVCQALVIAKTPKGLKAKLQGNRVHFPESHLTKIKTLADVEKMLNEMQIGKDQPEEIGIGIDVDAAADFMTNQKGDDTDDNNEQHGV